MSHIFISYAHKDKSYLDQLLNVLQEAGFDTSELWYDYHLEAGSQWIPQIDDALKEAFALVVVTTPKAMKSTYVTYEWSWALGNSIPVFPLLFEGSYDKVHARLRVEQGADCRTTIPDHIIETLKSKRDMPADTKYLNLKISEMVLPFRVITMITLWFYDNSNKSDYIIFNELVRKMLHVADTLQQNLLTLVVDKSYAFNFKLLRICRRLIEEIRSFWRIYYYASMGSQAYVGLGDIFEKTPAAKNHWENELQLILKDIKKSHWEEEALSTLEDVLTALASGKKSMESRYLMYDHNTVIERAFKDNPEILKTLTEAIEVVASRIPNDEQDVPNDTSDE